MKKWSIAAVALLSLLTMLTVSTTAGGQSQPFDPAEGQTLSVLPAGADGLVNVGELVQYEADGTRPVNSDSQLKMYQSLPYNPNLTESQLSDYYRPETFDLPANQVASVEQPDPSVPVTISWDNAGVPHINGQTLDAAAFGVGYAQAQDRLFEMDVLRHYGAGDLSSLVGPSCSDESMDQGSLYYEGATQAQLQAELNALPSEYPQDNLGRTSLDLIDSFVQGVNDYIKATRTNINMLPADYLAIGKLPTYWKPTDVADIASLIGGQLGGGGGGALENAGLLEYLEGQYGASAGTQIFNAFKEQNDPGAPTTVAQAFPYMSDPSTLNATLNALPDNASHGLTGVPSATTPGCNLNLSSPTSLATVLLPYLKSFTPSATAYVLKALPAIEKSVNTLVGGLANGLQFPATDSNALVVDGAHTTTGHPIAVFGPQVAYWSPEILMQEVVQAPGFAADGVSFPGTGLVELGRGLDYAWSATSAGTQNIDDRVVTICNPSGGAPTPQGTDYLIDGKCVPMTHETFNEVATPTPGGLGLPQVLTHNIYLADGGIVQGWTTVNGAPVAYVQERSDFLHDVDSIVAFLRFDSYSFTNSVQSWMQAANQIDFTFNWFYVDSKNAGFFTSGLDPERPAAVNANFPETDNPAAEWTGFLPASGHAQGINPASGFFVSWNNKPAPGYSAADSEYGYGIAYRSQMLSNNLSYQLYTHDGKVDRAQVVSAMASAATKDFDAMTVWPVLATALGPPADAHEATLLDTLESWVADGAHRIQATPGVGQYLHANAIAISDELFPQLVVALFGPLFAGGGVGTGPGGIPTGFNLFPLMGFTNAPGNLGSAYDGGWQGNVEKLLDQMAGIPVAQPYPASVLVHVCGPNGMSDCRAAIEHALDATWNAMVAANGGSSDSSTWTADATSAAQGKSIPSLDDIEYTVVGVVGQPAQPWQNRPTFQQVATFPTNRNGG